MNAKSKSSTAMKTINKLVLFGLLLTGAIIIASFVFGVQGSVISIASYFLGYTLMIYSLASFLWVGLLYVVQRKSGFFHTLYPLNGFLSLVGFLIVLFV